MTGIGHAVDGDLNRYLNSELAIPMRSNRPPASDAYCDFIKFTTEMHRDLMIVKNAGTTTFENSDKKIQSSFDTKLKWERSRAHCAAGGTNLLVTYSNVSGLITLKTTGARPTLRLNFNICIVPYERASRRASVRHLSVQVWIVSYK